MEITPSPRHPHQGSVSAEEPGLYILGQKPEVVLLEEERTLNPNDALETWKRLQTNVERI